MRRANVYVSGGWIGTLEELKGGARYRFSYRDGYDGPPVSLTMPIGRPVYEFDRFPPFFEGLLPEGEMLAGLLAQRKLDVDDYFGQLIAVGQDLVGAVTVEGAE
jgi:serine/threonine-protein kinase HipA